jgi:hypothetical protein
LQVVSFCRHQSLCTTSWYAHIDSETHYLLTHASNCPSSAGIRDGDFEEAVANNSTIYAINAVALASASAIASFNPGLVSTQQSRLRGRMQDTSPNPGLAVDLLMGILVHLVLLQKEHHLFAPPPVPRRLLRSVASTVSSPVLHQQALCFWDPFTLSCPSLNILHDTHSTSLAQCAHTFIKYTHLLRPSCYCCCCCCAPSTPSCPFPCTMRTSFLRHPCLLPHAHAAAIPTQAAEVGFQHSFLTSAASAGPLLLAPSTPSCPWASQPLTVHPRADSPI